MFKTRYFIFSHTPSLKKGGVNRCQTEDIHVTEHPTRKRSSYHNKHSIKKKSTESSFITAFKGMF